MAGNTHKPNRLYKSALMQVHRDSEETGIHNPHPTKGVAGIGNILKYRMSGLEVYKNTCLFFST
jgi:hypothetical protein